MQKFDSINVIPFIDIMLVLLAIVLTTATFVANGQLDITLPTATSESASNDLEKIEIAVDRQNQLFYTGEPVTLSELDSNLAQLETTTAIILRVDESVPFSQFISVIDLLKQRKLDRVSVLTRKTANGSGNPRTPDSSVDQ